MAARPARSRTLRERALGLLARREWPRVELRARLAKADVSEAEVESLLDDLQREGYLSDARYAGALVRQRAGTHARRAIASALRERGVEPEAAREALAELDGVDELEQAKALWQRRFGAAPRDEREKARQVRFLAGRGFPVAVALRVVREAA